MQSLLAKRLCVCDCHITCVWQIAATELGSLVAHVQARPTRDSYIYFCMHVLIFSGRLLP